MLTPRFVHQAVQYTSAIFSLYGNGLLILVVLHKTNRTFGSYRALLVAFACTDITISLVHAYVLPVRANPIKMEVYVQTEYGLVAFILDVLDLRPEIYSMVNVLTICLFYESFPLLTCHFIYRYLAVLFVRGCPHLHTTDVGVSHTFTLFANVKPVEIRNNANDHYFDEILLTEYHIDMRSPHAQPMVHLNFLHSRNGNWNVSSLKSIVYLSILHVISLSVDGFCVWRILYELNNNFSHFCRKRNIEIKLCRTLIILTN
ncbi:hypothetical protein PRIPAC_80169 [Pristionchus pacificus]|uniref:G protein-coupled receptor n=1 Tax=Pristionchus pacificus TaxID=54126 RepID=A0A2A6CMJ7_PRIPA|nr:hypothetical protein PRIPAC_80169 [Pristionchus pacificus]|eukprot:PDM79422.1 G protein-coupled receptor [Pristionchus pacificus]